MAVAGRVAGVNVDDNWDQERLSQPKESPGAGVWNGSQSLPCAQPVALHAERFAPQGGNQFLIAAATTAQTDRLNSRTSCRA
jgi:hypothetical protein